jgi:NADH dehydrogenase
MVRTGAGELPYDVWVMALGATTNYFGVPGAAEFSMPLKTLEDAGRIRNRALRCMEMAAHDEKENAERLLNWAIVGGGPTGIEMATELVDYAQSYGATIPSFPLELLRVELYQADKELLPMFSPRVRKIATDVLARKGIRVHTNTNVVAVEEEAIRTTDKTVPVGFSVWTAGIASAPLEITPASAVPRGGRYSVLPSLNLESHPEVFIVGDQVRIDGVPQTGQAAVAEARIAGRNIMALLKNKPLQSFVFKKKGDFVSLGQWQAVGDIYGVPFRGALAWWIWRTIYLFKLVGLPNQIRVAIDWTINLFFPRDLTEL